MTLLDPDAAVPTPLTAPQVAASSPGSPWPEPWCAQPWNRPRSEYWDLLTGVWVPCPTAPCSGEGGTDPRAEGARTQGPRTEA